LFFGNEEDFSVALGFAVAGIDENFSVLDSSSFKKMIGEVVKKYPNLKIIASTLVLCIRQAGTIGVRSATARQFLRSNSAYRPWRFLTALEVAIHLLPG